MGGRRDVARAFLWLLQIDVCDIWTDYTPWPCNQLPKSYNFMVKYSILWRLK